MTVEFQIRTLPSYGRFLYAGRFAGTNESHLAANAL
jgi:hypothetical protein